LSGVKLVISDAHEGLKAAIRWVFNASWQRCRVHWMRNALSYVPPARRRAPGCAKSRRSGKLKPPVQWRDRAGIPHEVEHGPLLYEVQGQI
jgi:hypothetical protein